MKESKKQLVVERMLIVALILLGISLVIDIILIIQQNTNENGTYNVLRDVIAMGIMFLLYKKLRKNKDNG